MHIALVTGSSRGIGLATVQALLNAGHYVIATDISKPEPSLFPQEQQNRLMTANLDVTSEKTAQVLINHIKTVWGDVDILVNNAGISPKMESGNSATLMEISPEEWENVLNVNLTSVMHLCRLVALGMKEKQWGRIVNITSLAGRTRSGVTGASYAASKAALIGLTRILAGELGAFGITSNSVAPGRILTEMVLKAGENVNKAYAEAIPLKRLGTPKEVAAVIAFLASEEASFVNGALIDVNGGSFMP